MQTKSDILLDKIKNMLNFSGIMRIKRATYEKASNTLTVSIISSIALLDSDISLIKEEFSKALCDINIVVISEKSIADCDITLRAIKDIISSEYYTVSHLVNFEETQVTITNDIIKFYLSVYDEIYDYAIRTAMVEKVESILRIRYANNFSGDIRITQKERVEDTRPEEVVISRKIQTRFVKMCCVDKYLDEKLYDTAVYIDDASSSRGSMTLAGKIISIVKKEIQPKGENQDKKKYFYVITFDDYTGKMTGRFFTGDASKIKKLDKLGEGSVVIMRCENEEFNGGLSLTIKGLHLCEFPKNYVPKEKPSKEVEKDYKLVFPKQEEVVKQNDLFSKEVALPKEFIKTNFTIVDIETTGTEVGKDKITEIGAVKVENGKIVSSFQTLVNPQMAIPEKIVKLTGITDDMVKDAPLIEDVFHDFFKYLGDTVFVAHNTEFDYRFLRTAGKEVGYFIKNKTLDTLEISRKVVPTLKNHKLNTVCDYYGIEFRHHRALADAFATAELLIELIKTQKSFTF